MSTSSDEKAKLALAEEEKLRLEREAEEERIREEEAIRAELKMREHWKKRFAQLTSLPLEEQCTFFLKRYIFTLNEGKKWKEVKALSTEFIIAAQGDDYLEPPISEEFLHKHNKVRFEEDILDPEGNLSFIEFCCIYYRKMILQEYFKRYSKEADVNLDDDSKGLNGQTTRVIEEMFAVPVGLDPDLEKLMAEFSLMHAKKEAKEQELKKLAKLGGVKGLTAQNQLNAMKNEDLSQIHEVEIKVAAALKRAQKATEEELARVIAVDEWEKQTQQQASNQ